ncbi:hypothetical protein C3R44_21410, partial [Mycobacterium tuberculosis]
GDGGRSGRRRDNSEAARGQGGAEGGQTEGKESRSARGQGRDRSAGAATQVNPATRDAADESGQGQGAKNFV